MTAATATEPSVLTRSVGIEVFGEPRPKGSLQCLVSPAHPLREDAKGIRPWRRAVEKHASEHLGGPYEGPVRVHATFTLPFPAGMKPERRTWPHVRVGDVDKLARLALDALESAGVLGNDAQVVELVARKAYPHSPCPDVLDQPGVRIRLLPMEASADAGEGSGRGGAG